MRSGTNPREKRLSGLMVRNISKAYDQKEVLRDVSFSLYPGEVLGVCGSNGTGKTTLIHLLASILIPDSGKITLFGVSARAGRAYRESIGLVPQQIALSPRLTVLQNLDFWASMRGLSGQRRRETVEKAIALTNIAGFLHLRVSRCSGGMARRANLAAGLVGFPALILLDEPTAGLDEETRDIVLTTVKALKNSGHMLVMVNHYQEEIKAVSGRILKLDSGQPSSEALGMA